MDTIRSLSHGLLAFLVANPEVTSALFIAVVWPVLSGLMSLVWGHLERRAPNVVALLRAMGMDLPKAKAALIAIVRAAFAKKGVAAPEAVSLTFPNASGLVTGDQIRITNAIGKSDVGTVDSVAASAVALTSLTLLSEVPPAKDSEPTVVPRGEP